MGQDGEEDIAIAIALDLVNLKCDSHGDDRQNAAQALKLADQAYLLETGRVVVSGTADAIRSDEAVRRSYLGY